MKFDPLAGNRKKKAYLISDYCFAELYYEINIWRGLVHNISALSQSDISGVLIKIYI
jgi:hypothetical protein